MIYPWQVEQMQQVWRLKQENRLPHALLLVGMTGIGKAVFADGLTRVLLCQHLTTNGVSCDNCHACRLIKGRAHPNVLWIEPEKTGQAIKIDQIRDVTEFIQQSSLQGDYRIVVIHPADNLNMHAANALLKTLEEPASGAILVLISHQPAKLPATILSRCQRITFPRPNREQAVNWLQNQLTDTRVNIDLLLNLAHGAPLGALAILHEDTLTIRQNLLQALYALSQKQGDPVRLAANLQELEPLQMLDFMLSWLMDLLRLQLGMDATYLTNKDYSQQLIDLKNRTQMQTNAKLMEYTRQLRGHMQAGINFNKQLMLEDLLIRWMQNASCFEKGKLCF